MVGGGKATECVHEEGKAELLMRVLLPSDIMRAERSAPPPSVVDGNLGAT